MKAKLAKRKTGFCMRMKESWKEMKLWDAEELNKLDTTGRVFCGFRILQISRGLPSAEIFQ